MKEFLKKYRKQIFIFIIIGVFLIPFLIYLDFKIPAICSFFNAYGLWTAGDILAFYGVLLGTTATIIGVFLSIQHAQSNYREDIRNQSLPYVALTTLDAMYRYNIIFDSPHSSDSEDAPTGSSQNYYEEYFLDRLFFIIDKGKIYARKKFTKEQTECIKRIGQKWVTDAQFKTETLVPVNLIYFPIVVENVGNGPALYFKVGLNSINIPKEQRLLTKPISLKKAQRMFLYIYSENRDDCNLGVYELIMKYRDLYRNEYEQHYFITIYKDETGCHGKIESNDPEQILVSKHL